MMAIDGNSNVALGAIVFLGSLMVEIVQNRTSEVAAFEKSKNVRWWSAKLTFGFRLHTHISRCWAHHRNLANLDG